jgi:hypothetical protein
MLTPPWIWSGRFHHRRAGHHPEVLPPLPPLVELGVDRRFPSSPSRGQSVPLGEPLDPHLRARVPSPVRQGQRRKTTVGHRSALDWTARVASYPLATASADHQDPPVGRLNASPTRAWAEWAGDLADRPRSVRSGPRDVFISKPFIFFRSDWLAARNKSQNIC